MIYFLFSIFYFISLLIYWPDNGENQRRDIFFVSFYSKPNIVFVWIHVCVSPVCVSRFFFFFFFQRFGKTWLLFMYCSMNSNSKCWLFCRKQCIMYCSWSHKFHFLATFSLKMGHTILFTHLKIILLQWFQQ